MRIGVITPTRGTRPAFLERCKYYVSRQTVPVEHLIVDYPQKRFQYDLTDRYRVGLKKLENKCDLIFFMEDDDYYPSNYIETMVNEWKISEEPEIFGIGESYFYHAEEKFVWYKKHPETSSCMYQMCIRADAIKKIDWSLVNDLFTDSGLWKQLKWGNITIGMPLAIGIKHGRGECAAGGHNRWFYINRQDPANLPINHPKLNYDQSKSTSGPHEWVLQDPDGSWLRSAIGADAEWYENFARNKEMR